MCHSLPEDQLGHEELAYNAALLVLPCACHVGAEAVQAQQHQVQIAHAHCSLPALAAGRKRCAPQSQLHEQFRTM